MSRRARHGCLGLGFLVLVAVGGCVETDAVDPGWNRMLDQPRQDRTDPSPVFANRATLQAPPPLSVPREAGDGLPGARRLDGSFRRWPPVSVDQDFLQMGQRVFDRDCAICHGHLADGRSFVAERMQRVPPADLQEPRYQQMPLGRLYQVVTEGYGAMPGFAGLSSDRERWAAVSYLRCLQWSRSLDLEELDPARQAQLRELLP